MTVQKRERLWRLLGALTLILAWALAMGMAWL